MEKIRYRLIYNRKNKLNKQGKALVQAEAYLNNRKAYFTTKVYLYPGEWDNSTAQVTGTAAKDLNAYLYEFIINLQAIELSYWKRGVQCTLSLLKESHKKNRQTDVNFHTFALNAIEDSDRKQSTKDNLKTTITALNEFRKGIDFKDLTYNFIKDFENHLKQQKKATNTIAKHLRQLRTLINEAINQGYMKQEEYPFRKFKIKKEKGKHTVLTKNELKRLEKLELIDKRHQHILDAFLFCVYSGLRYSDFKSLTENNIIHIRGNKWLYVRMKKTGIQIRLPLYLLFEGKALGLVERHGTLQSIANVGTNSEVNRTLKEIMAHANIRKRVTWHTARHTHASLLLYQGVPITTVQKLLGHTSVRTTEIYTEVFNDTVVKDLKAVRKRPSDRNTVESMRSTW